MFHDAMSKRILEKVESFIVESVIMSLLSRETYELRGVACGEKRINL